jgi:hypothetical protein
MALNMLADGAVRDDILKAYAPRFAVLFGIGVPEWMKGRTMSSL